MEKTKDCFVGHIFPDLEEIWEGFNSAFPSTMTISANFIIIFQQDDLNLRHIFNNHVGNDFTFQEFKNLCNECWREKYGFLVIDKERAKNEGKYRCKIDKFYSDNL